MSNAASACPLVVKRGADACSMRLGAPETPPKFRREMHWIQHGRRSEPSRRLFAFREVGLRAGLQLERGCAAYRMPRCRDCVTTGVVKVFRTMSRCPVAFEVGSCAIAGPEHKRSLSPARAVIGGRM